MTMPLPPWVFDALEDTRCANCRRKIERNDALGWHVAWRYSCGTQQVGMVWVHCRCGRHQIIEHFRIGMTLSGSTVLPSISPFAPRDPISVFDLQAFRQRLKRTSFKRSTKSWRKFIGHFLPDRYVNYPSPEADELEKPGEDEQETP